MTDEATPTFKRYVVHYGDDYVRVLAEQAHTDDYLADCPDSEQAELIAAALNAYDPSREAKVRALVKAAEKVWGSSFLVDGPIPAHSPAQSFHPESIGTVNLRALIALREALSALGETV